MCSYFLNFCTLLDGTCLTNSELRDILLCWAPRRFHLSNIFTVSLGPFCTVSVLTRCCSSEYWALTPWFRETSHFKQPNYTYASISHSILISLLIPPSFPLLSLPLSLLSPFFSYVMFFALKDVRMSPVGEHRSHENLPRPSPFTRSKTNIVSNQMQLRLRVKISSQLKLIRPPNSVSESFSNCCSSALHVKEWGCYWQTWNPQQIWHPPDG